MSLGFEVRCPHCREKLSDADHIINGSPGIRVRVRVGEVEGEIWLSSRFGDLQIDSGEIEIPDNAVVEFACPHCREKISNGKMGNCGRCQAPMVAFKVVMEAQVCSRRGCAGYRMGEVESYGPRVIGF